MTHSPESGLANSAPPATPMAPDPSCFGEYILWGPGCNPSLWIVWGCLYGLLCTKLQLFAICPFTRMFANSCSTANQCLYFVCYFRLFPWFWVCLSMYACNYTNTFLHTNTHTYVHIFAHTGTHVYTHKYVFLATWSHTMYISWRFFSLSVPIRLFCYFEESIYSMVWMYNTSCDHSLFHW